VLHWPSYLHSHIHSQPHTIDYRRLYRADLHCRLLSLNMVLPEDLNEELGVTENWLSDIYRSIQFQLALGAVNGYQIPIEDLVRHTCWVGEVIFKL